VTSQGVNPLPVISPVLLNGSGKLNYQGTKFVCTGEYDPVIGNFLGFQLYDFNAATGQISNPVNIPFQTSGDVLQYFEFTFDGNYLYAGGPYSFYHFDLSSGNPNLIAASGTELFIGNSSNPHIAPQMGPDSNLYYVVANTTSGLGPNTLYKIENPSNPASLIGPISALPANVTPSIGLPQWIALISDEIITGNNVISLTGDNCFQSAQTFSFSGTSAVVSITWNFGDPTSGVNNSSSDLYPSHQFSEIGTYQITAIVEFDCYVDTLTQNITLFNCTDTITPPPAFEFPNIFTPNNDGINDFFEIDNLPENTEVIILNRWGNVVFSSENYQNNWDGKDDSGRTLVDGVYTYKFKMESGTIGHGLVHLIK
jgi:gliding motility-associated-like protein